MHKYYVKVKQKPVDKCVKGRFYNWANILYPTPCTTKNIYKGFNKGYGNIYADKQYKKRGPKPFPKVTPLSGSGTLVHLA